MQAFFASSVPLGLSEEERMKKLAMPFVFRAKIICMEGIPKDKTKLPSSAKIVNYEKAPQVSCWLSPTLQAGNLSSQVLELCLCGAEG